MMETYLRHVLDFGSQFTPSAFRVRNCEGLKRIPKPDRIIIVGMGGSGLPAEFIKDATSVLGLRVPVTVWHDYGIPKTGAKRPFYIFVSFSGDTEETLSGLQKLIRTSAKRRIALVTTGGIMETIGARVRLPMVTFRASDLTPRGALGYTTNAVIILLHTLFPTIRSTHPKLNPLSFETTARALARSLRNRIPVIYTDEEHSFLGYVWKVNFNETAKHPAFNNILPEATHNEIAGFEERGFPFTALFLLDTPTQKIARKTKVFMSVLKKLKVPAMELKAKGKNETERVWNSIILSHLTSFHLAELKHINPTRTKSIDLLKKSTK